MILYLSEDNDNSPLIRLFNSSYDRKILIGTDGNTGLLNGVCESAKGGHRVVVYMDMVPKNRKLFGLYEDLLDLYYKNGIDVVVLPIVCSEFAFIQSVYDLDGVVKNTSGLQEILTKSADFGTSGLAVNNKFNQKKTFESFCKLFCKVCLRSCCSLTGSAEEISDKLYFKLACSCDYCGLRLTLLEKSARYLQQYLVVPRVSENGAVESSPSSWEAVISISHKLVDEYNSWSRRVDDRHRDLRKRI